MKTIKALVFFGVIVLISSCVTTAQFPVSDVAPAAQITAKIKQDNNKNNVIKLTAKHLAEASRLNPTRNNYSVWIIADNGMVKNVGQLINRNAEKASLTITTPFNVNEIFITAEDRGNQSYPAGIEISRTTFNK